eukprot:6756381-Prymnesium_polylepis.1
MCSIAPRLDPLEPRIGVSSPHGTSGTASSRLGATGRTIVQQAVALYRPEYGQSLSYSLLLGGAAAASRSAPSYSSTLAAQSVQAVVATPTLYYTDQLSSSSMASRYRTIRVAYMLLDEDYRPNVDATSARLRLEGAGGSAVESSCGTTSSGSSHHTCTLLLSQQHFATVSTNASLALIAGSTSFSAPVTLSPLPPWVASYCAGLVHASCTTSDNFLYARAPAGPVVSQSQFSVQVLLRHTTNAGVVNFRFQFDPTVATFVSSSMLGSQYSAMQLSDPPLSFSGTSFSTGYDALVSASTFDTTYAPSTEPTLVCTLTFRALSAGDALRMSVTQVLSVGDSTLIDHNEAFVEID